MEKVDDQKGGESVYICYLCSNRCHLFAQLVNSLLKCLGLIHHDPKDDEKEDPPCSVTEKEKEKPPPSPDPSKGGGGKHH